MSDDMFDFECDKADKIDEDLPKGEWGQIGHTMKIIDTNKSFYDSVHAIIDVCYKRALHNGFWDEEENALIPESKVKALKVALMAEELFEAFKEIRDGNGNGPSDHIPEFNYEEEELADVIIRIFDYAGKYKLRLPEAILAKIAYNKSRPYKHGKKF